MTYSKWAGWTTCSKPDIFFLNSFFNCCERWKGALRLTCWQGRGSFESSHRPCLSSLTAGARWWPSRSPCWTQSGSRHCLYTPPRWALSRDPWLWSLLAWNLAQLWHSDSWWTGFITHSPIVEFPEAPSWHNNRMWGVYLRVELWVIFNTGTDLQERVSFHFTPL